MTTLLIVRHGNTFDEGELPRRVGKHTDLPLVAKGIEQAQAVGNYLKQQQLIPDQIYCSQLQRTQQTAIYAMQAMGCKSPIKVSDIFDEIDYGPDENKEEAEVIARIGKEAIDSWEKESIVPEGWKVDPEEICQQWQAFANDIAVTMPGKIIMVVTSNGIARFVPSLLEDEKAFDAVFSRKIATGGICHLQLIDKQWVVKTWNIKAIESSAVVAVS